MATPATRTMNAVHDPATCAVAASAEIIGAKWTALLVHDLSEGPRRFSQLEHSCSGISPRTLPGMPGGVFSTTSDEHDPQGHITEGIENRIAMMRKRMGKLETAAREIPSTTKFTVHGPRQAELTLVGWGATKGAILDAMP